MENKTLWTKDFTLITIGTVISVIGGQVIQIPLSLTVFAHTGSVLQSSFLVIVALLPSTIIPILAAPVIDRNRKKPVIVGLDYFMAAFYFVAGIMLSNIGFNYWFYLLGAFILGTIGSVYSNTYQAWYPDIIPKGFEHKGYAVSGTLYPTVNIVMAPLSTYLYEKLDMHILFYIVGALVFCAATFELFIRENFVCKPSETAGFRAYLTDVGEGFRYIHREKGITNIYAYMGITGGVSEANMLLIQAYFQSSAWLSATLFGFLRSAETVGRMLAGIVQYNVVVPAKKRFGITKFVYYTYEISDMLLLFMPFPLMLVSRFTCGALGMTSATLRQASVQSYLEPQMRAKVNAVFSAYSNIMIILFQFLGGVVGDLLGYRAGVVFFSLFCVAAVYFLIHRPSDINRRVYEAERISSESAGK